MTSKSPRDVSASVRARLLNISKRNSEAFDLVLVRFAIERLGIANSRMKDYFDLFVLCTEFEFDGELICQAIKATFDRRKTVIPDALPLALRIDFSEDKQKSVQWNAFLRKCNLTGKHLDLTEVTTRLAGFLMPPAEAARFGSTFVKLWHPSKGWTEKK